MRLPSPSKSLVGVAAAAAALTWTSLAPVGAAPQVQTQQPPPVPVTQGTQTLQPRPADHRLMLIAGRSELVTIGFEIVRVSMTDDTVADVVPVTTRQLLINGKKPGTVSMWVWGQEGQQLHYELVVDPGITTLQQKLQQLFPGEDIQVSLLEGALVLSGRVSNNNVMIRAADIAQASAPAARVINLLQLPGGIGSQQVLLQVRVAEVNRRAIRELGISLFATRAGFTARGTTQQFPAPDFDDVAGGVGGLEFGDFLNLFFFQRTEGIGGVMKALEQAGWLESLAEPNLIAYNGKEASFLAGGEIPVPIANANGTPSIDWKEFGVRLRFLPTIAGDFIRLKVRPEVSALDFANGVTLSGFRIPALTTRYADTEVELRDGQSFAIAGLLNTINQEDKANIPFLSKIPVIGNIFKSKANREDKTELMVLITPRLVRPLNPDEVPPLPSVIKPPTGRGGGSGGSGSGSELPPQLKGPAGIIDAPGGRGKM